MTRARCYALALVVGVCCLGPTPAFAQTGPMPQPGYAPGAPGQPFETPPPMNTTPWYGAGDDVEPSINMFGPQAKVSSWFIRAEYLNWNIGSPGKVPLGAPVVGVTDPTKPFIVFAPGTSTPEALAVVPTTDSIRLNDTSGVQVTAGLQLIDGGQFEVSAFMLGKKQSGFSNIYGGLFDPSQLLFTQFGIGTGLPGSQTSIPVVAATSTLTNGQLGDHVFLYNTSYQAIMVSQLWGAEANYLMDDDVGDVLQFMPLAGVRYLNLTERLNINGVFVDQHNPAPGLDTSIYSQVNNNLWGGQVGFRAQVVTKYIDFGVTPKLMFLGNTAMSIVDGANFLDRSGLVSSSEVTTKFTFGSEANGFVNVHLSPSFSLRGGYTVMWINSVTRPQRDIVYNDNGTATAPGIGQQLDFHDIFIYGFNFGCEFRF